MRWSASLLAVGIAACGAPPPTAQAPAARPACTPVAPRCEPSVDDRTALALVQTRCYGCHGTHGVAGHDFPSIDALRAAPVAEMVGTCQMPPDGAVLTATERIQLVTWAACASPDRDERN